VRVDPNSHAVGAIAQHFDLPDAGNALEIFYHVEIGVVAHVDVGNG
jgi:hypothetical protein